MDEEKREQEIIERWKDETDQPLMEQEYFEFLKHLEQKKQAKESNADNSTCHGEPRRTMTAETSTQAEDGLPERSRRETADDSTQAEEQLLSERSRRETADDSTQAEEQLFPQRSRRETAEDNDFTLDDLGLDPHQREEFTRILQSPIPIPGFEHLQPNLNKPDNESDNEDDALTLAA
jgi:hypothetical protein